jgi:DNA-binding CsgD family transcriptional regulator
MSKLIYNLDPLHQALVMPEMTFYGTKDENLDYTSMCSRIVPMLGFSNPDQIIGCNDYDMRCKGVQLAALFREQDRQVFHTHQPLLTLNIVQYQPKPGVMLGLKEITCNNQLSINGRLLPADYFQILGFHHLLKDHDYYQQNTNRCFIISRQIGNLSKKESEVLYHLIRHRSARQTANYMVLSQRTIESYISNIRNKLNCGNITQLIEKSIFLNFQDQIPAHILPLSQTIRSRAFLQ